MDCSQLSNRNLQSNFNLAFEALSFAEKEGLYTQVDQVVDLLDESAVKELFSGSENDIYNIFDVILQETYNVLNLRKYNSSLGGLTLEQVPEVKAGFEEYLRKINLNYFVHSVLPHFEMNWHNIEWFNMLQLYRLLCIMAARDHSKSYSFSFAYPLWRLYRYTRPTAVVTPPDEIKFYKEGMIITNEFKLAKKLLKKIKEEIQVNPILREALYPEKNIGGWANESITCKTGAEITLSSFRTSNRGPHPGWIVVDDFLDKSAIYSKEQREKFVEVFNAEIMNMILPQGQVAVVGTPFHEKDLYVSLKEDPQWNVFEYPAVFPDGSILWSNRYSFDALKAKRITLGSMIFSREILVRPVSDSTSIFPWSTLELSFVNMGNICLVENRQSYPVKLKKVAIGVDWALSANAGADYTEMCVGGIDELDQIHLLSLVSLHGAGYNEQIATLQRLNSNFQPDVILAETNGFQKVMVGLAKETGLTNIVEETTTANSKKDIYNGLPSLAVLFEQGKYKFPRGNEKSREVTNALCSQLNSIAFDDDKGTLEGIGEHDDKAMALFFMTKGLKYMGGGFKVSQM